MTIFNGCQIQSGLILTLYRISSLHEDVICPKGTFQTGKIKQVGEILTCLYLPAASISELDMSVSWFTMMPFYRFFPEALWKISLRRSSHVKALET